MGKNREEKISQSIPVYSSNHFLVIDNSSSTRNYSRMSSNIEERFKDPVIYRDSRRTWPDCVPLNVFARRAFIDRDNKDVSKYLKI